MFFPLIRWRPKKGLHRNLGQYSTGISRIYSCWLTLFRLIIQRSILNGRTPKSRWGDAKSRWGDANSRWGTRPPYNLNTGFIAAKYVYCAVYYVQCLLNCSLGQHSNKIQLTNIFNVLVMSDAGLDDICKQRWT